MVNHTVKVKCDYCPGYYQQMLEDHDMASVEGDIEPLVIEGRDKMENERRVICPNCVIKALDKILKK